MRINSIRFANIRNHKNTELEFHSKVNVFRGLNGAGKTSILEAIAIAGLSKSFMPVGDSQILRRDESEYSITLKSRNDLNIPYFVNIKYSNKTGKTISNNTKDRLLPKDIVGELPVVVLSPDSKEITYGSPSERRSFLDKILSQSYRSYFSNWIKLKKILNHRSSLLSKYAKDSSIGLGQYDILTDMLIDVSAEIVLKRCEFIDSFSGIFEEVYADISEGKEKVALQYKAFSVSDTSSADAIKEQIVERAEKYKSDELRRGMNLFGPQRDNLNILINGGVARDYASQGQHKSLIAAIKFAELRFMKEILNETPVLLLDDIFSELDQNRIEKVLTLVREYNTQTFITVNNATFLDYFSSNEEYKLFEVIGGEARECTQ